jgi:TctA family transporter
MLSAVLFAIGAVAGVLLASALFKEHRHAATWLGLGSLWNALFIPLPLLLAELSLQGISVSPNVAEPMLLWAVLADALFNGCLAISMAIVAQSLWASHRMLAISGLIIAIPTFLVIGQFHARWAADLIGIAGPAWLTWWLILSWKIRSTAEPSPTTVQ